MYLYVFFFFFYLFVDIYQYTFTKENFSKTVKRYFWLNKYFWYFLLSKERGGSSLFNWGCLGGVRLVVDYNIE